MGILSKLFGSHDEEEVPVLKTEHYPVDEPGGEDDYIPLSEIMIDPDEFQNFVCPRCAAVYYGFHRCRK